MLYVIIFSRIERVKHTLFSREIQIHIHTHKHTHTHIHTYVLHNPKLINVKYLDREYCIVDIFVQMFVVIFKQFISTA